MTYNVQSVKVSFNGPLTTKVRAATLSALWERTDAVQPDSSGMFISLRVNMAERPISLREGDGWLGSVTAISQGTWDVLLWRRQLFNPRLFTDPKDQLAANEIIREAETSSPSIWTMLSPKLMQARTDLPSPPLG